MSFYIISFAAGALISAFVSYFVFANKTYTMKAELIKYKTVAETSGSLQDIIKQDFVRLANEVIKNEQEDLRKQNREALEEKLLPLSKELSEFKKKVDDFNESGVKNTTEIRTRIDLLNKNNEIIQKEANNLVQALTKNQNVKGAYGEGLLDTILQSCGMKEGVHYTKQYTTTSENLKDNEIHKVRPDVVINLPDERHIIIDSKVTLESYLKCVDDPSKINEFKSEVKSRINDLAKKNYQNAGDLYQPDFILMYMPIETSVNLLYEDLELLNLAYKSNIIIVGTASLLTVIRLVNQMLAQQKQTESVQRIVTAGTNLYETFVQFCEDLKEVKRQFDDVAGKLNTTINRFQRGNKNKPSLFSQVDTLKEYGINTTKEIPEQFLKQDIEETEECVLTND